MISENDTIHDNIGVRVAFTTRRRVNAKSVQCSGARIAFPHQNKFRNSKTSCDFLSTIISRPRTVLLNVAAAKLTSPLATLARSLLRKARKNMFFASWRPPHTTRCPRNVSGTILKNRFFMMVLIFGGRFFESHLWRILNIGQNR